MTTDLKDRRLAAGLTQQEVAERAQCSIAYVAMLERGYRPGRPSAVLARVSDVIDAASDTGPGD